MKRTTIRMLVVLAGASMLTTACYREIETASVQVPPSELTWLQPCESARCAQELRDINGDPVRMSGVPDVDIHLVDGAILRFGDPIAAHFDGEYLEMADGVGQPTVIHVDDIDHIVVHTSQERARVDEVAAAAITVEVFRLFVDIALHAL